MKHIKTFESYSVNEGNERTPEEIANEWSEKEGNNFFLEFLKYYPTKEDFEQRLEDYKNLKDEDEAEIYMLETEFNSFPGEDKWNVFIFALYKSSWGDDHEDKLPDWMK